MKINNRGLATNSIILTTVQCFTYGSSFIQTMILSRTFTKYEYGTYSQGMLLVNFTAPLFLLGLSNAANYFYSRRECDDKAKVEQVVNTIFTLIALMGGVGGLLIIALQAPIQAYFSNEGLLAIIYPLAFRPLLQNLVSFFQVLYVSSGRVRIIAIRNSIISALQLAIVVVAAYYMRNVVLVCILLVLTDIVQVLVFHAFFNYAEFKVSPVVPQLLVVRDVLKYALPLALSTAIGTISINMDTMMIGRMMSTEDFAMYSNMAKELPFNIIISSFSTVVYPKIVSLTAKGEKEKTLQTYKLYVESGLITTWILVFGAFACGKELLLVLYSDKYIEGLPIFLVYLLVAGLRFTYFGALLTANGDTKSIFKYSVYSVICNFILNIALFYTLGVIGPAVATLITVFLSGYLQMSKGIRIYNLKINDVFDWHFIIPFFGFSTLLIILVYWCKSFIDFIPLLPRGIIIFSIVSIALAAINRKRIVFNIKELNKQQ